ncbi:MAG: hypothetical protein DRP64_13845 [Verrucomicrobia bacterium]|nr:MAG: hypothetical protein DRP64_13845 [Verrucomicrobiota bacterium]
MDAIKFRLASLLMPLLIGGVYLVSSPGTATGADESSTVIWYDDDKQPIPMPKPDFPKETLSVYDENFSRPTDRFFHPTRFIRRIGRWFGGDIALPAANVNAYDEVPNSTWFTNRIGLTKVTPEDCARGCRTTGPNTDQRWRVLGAKTDGVTPGFLIRDADGNKFLLKLDPAGYVGTTVRASVISSLILYGCGFNVPAEYAVTFGPDDLLIEGDLSYRPLGGGAIPLTSDNLAEVLGEPHTADGRWIAVASHYLAGKPLGPFDYKGRRDDDPNDRINHEDRRELRGLYVFSAWLNHFDSKRDNTLDMYVGEPGEGHVKHYLIDFASTLGAGGTGPTQKWGWEYGMDIPASTGRLVSLGFHEDRWVALERPAGLDEIGYMDNRWYDPIEWKPIRPNTSFAHLTNRDGYWAAKIVTAFTDKHLAYIVDQADYENPAATEFMTRALAERRDIIGRYWFGRVPPLDFFTVSDGAVVFADLGVERALFDAASSRYRSRWRSHDGGWTEWSESDRTVVELERDAVIGYPIRVQCQVSRGGGWSGATEVTVVADGRVTSLVR